MSKFFFRLFVYNTNIASQLEKEYCIISFSKRKNNYGIFVRAAEPNNLPLP